MEDYYYYPKFFSWNKINNTSEIVLALQDILKRLEILEEERNPKYGR